MPNNDSNLIIDLINSTIPPSEREYYFKALNDLIEQILNENAANNTNVSAVANNIIDVSAIASNTDISTIRNKINERCN